MTPEMEKVWADFPIPTYAMLDVWLALGGNMSGWMKWLDEPRRGPADAWSQLLAWVRRTPPNEDTNPPAGPHPAEVI